MDSSSDASVRLANLRVDQRQTRRAIVRELRLVEGAIALVAAGTAPRVTVGGLAFGAQIMARVTSMARDRRVTVLEHWSPWSDTSQVEVRLDG